MLDAQEKTAEPSFAKELEAIKTSLPKRYGTIITHLHPDVTLSDIYNVVNAGVKNRKILGYLKECAETAKKNLQKNNRNLL
jgi:hypothetical protein